MRKRIQLKQKTQTALWIKVASTVGVLTILGGIAIFIIMNLRSEESKAEDGFSMVKSISTQPVLWVRADDNSSQSDGSTLNQWNDKSNNGNHLKQGSSSKRPGFYKNSDHINSLGVFKYDGSDDIYEVDECPEINTANSYDNKTIFMVFRSGLDVQRTQVLFEEGNAACGLNMLISDGYVITGIWNQKKNPKYKVFFREPIQVETSYSLTIKFDGSNSFYASYLNGELIDSSNAVSTLPKHPGGIGVGNEKGGTLIPDTSYFSNSGSKSGVANSNSNVTFEGVVAELIYYDGDVPTDSDESLIENGLTSDYYLDSESSTLPISLVSFNVEQEDNQVVVEWTTASEENNDYFTIERSSDGKTFEEIGTVMGAGTTYNEQDYSFIDNASGSGELYYRLKQTDFDGKYEYFPIVKVQADIEKIPVLSIQNLYPNPFETRVTLEVASEEIGSCYVKIYDGRGVTVRSLEVDIEQGFNSIVMDDLGSLPQGNYFCILEMNGEKTVAVKLIK